MNTESGVLELGAQWIHGQHENPLYSLAKERDLISNPKFDFGIEGSGIFFTDSGKAIDEELVEQIVSHLHKIKDELYDNSENSDELVSVEQIFQLNFEKYIESESCPLIERHLLWAIFEWFKKFEVIDNSCNDLNEVSLLSYEEYVECEGIDLINFKDGYQTIIDSLANDIPRDWISLKTSVKRIEICNNTFRVNLYIKEKDRTIIESFDHLIITSSIGFLKNNMKSFFGMSLPQNKIDIINSLGFGTIDKIYLYFDKPFWRKDIKGLQLIWTNRDHNLPVWVYDITGFDLVRGQPNVLVAWIGGNGAKQMETIESDQSVGNICAQLLRIFLHNVNVSDPSKVIRSKWATNEYFCGAYSCRTLEYQKLNCDIETLSEPIIKTKHLNELNKSIDCPLILFGGEATDQEFYSTTHGAFRSGQREAQRLIKFYEQFN